MPNPILGATLETIANLIEGQRIAGPHYYEVVWIKDHFVCRMLCKTAQEESFIVKLLAKDVNEGLKNEKWDIITARVHTLIKTGVIK